MVIFHFRGLRSRIPSLSVITRCFVHIVGEMGAEQESDIQPNAVGHGKGNVNWKEAQACRRLDAIRNEFKLAGKSNIKIAQRFLQVSIFNRY